MDIGLDSLPINPLEDMEVEWESSIQETVLFNFDLEDPDYYREDPLLVSPVIIGTQMIWMKSKIPEKPYYIVVAEMTLWFGKDDYLVEVPLATYLMYKSDKEPMKRSDNVNHNGGRSDNINHEKRDKVNKKKSDSVDHEENDYVNYEEEDEQVKQVLRELYSSIYFRKEGNSIIEIGVFMDEPKLIPIDLSEPEEKVPARQCTKIDYYFDHIEDQITVELLIASTDFYCPVLEKKFKRSSEIYGTEAPKAPIKPKKPEPEPEPEEKSGVIKAPIRPKKPEPEPEPEEPPKTGVIGFFNRLLGIGHKKKDTKGKN